MERRMQEDVVWYGIQLKGSTFPHPHHYSLYSRTHESTKNIKQYDKNYFLPSPEDSIIFSASLPNRERRKGN